MVRWVLQWRAGLAAILLAGVLVGTGILVFRPFAAPAPPGALEIPAAGVALTTLPVPGTAATLTAAVPSVTPLAAPTTLPAPDPAALKVYITGAVAQPGVYSLHDGDRIEDVIRLAGGALSDADLDAINLAARVYDAEQIRVPHRGEAPFTPAAPPPTATVGLSTGGGSPPGTPPAGKVNINTADAPALETLPHIGPVLAARIIAYRTQHGRFARIEDIKQVSGIGDAIYSAIAPYLTLGP